MKYKIVCDDLNVRLHSFSLEVPVNIHGVAAAPIVQFRGIRGRLPRGSWGESGGSSMARYAI